MFFEKRNIIKKLSLRVLNVLLYLLDSVCIVFSAKAVKKNGLALVRLDGIGDFILWLDTAHQYLNVYENTEITLIADSSWAKLAECLPYWENVISVDTKKLYSSPAYRWNKIKEIRRIGFAVAIESTYSRVFLHGDSIIRATDAPVRIGSLGDLSCTERFFKTISDRWYTRLVPATSKPIMELERNTEFLSALFPACEKASVPALPTVAKLTDNLVMKEDYFIVFPGVSWSGKKWSAKSFAEIARQISLEHGWRVVLCGHRSELNICQDVIDHAKLPDAINLAGKSTMPELVEIIRGAKLLVGNDTAAVHIAAATKTPSVCILGGGNFGRFLPYSESIDGTKPIAVFEVMPCYGCNWSCTKSYVSGEPVPCIAAISVQAVEEAVRSAISASTIERA
jgi:ADP-heptose:LPS heptosyltransferase